MEKHLSTDVLDDVPTTLVLRDHPSNATSGAYLISSQDDDSSVTTLLSAGSYGVYTTDEEEDKEEEFERFNESREEKLLTLMRRHARRDRMLDRISRIKSPTLTKLIRRREYAVRQAKYEILFLQHLYDQRLSIDAALQEDDASTQARGIETTVSSFETQDSQSAEVDASSYEDSTIWYDAPSQPFIKTLDTDDDKKGFIHGLYDYAVMEWHTTMPAIFSLTIHSLAHAALYDGVEILSEEFKKHLEALSKTTKLYMNPTALGHFIMFFFGLLLLRASGQLYWWLNNSDFLCIKFDYHNRLHLRHWDARLLKWMKGHPVLQAVLYFIGYQFCFMVVNDIFDYGFYFFDQRDEILRHLPSIKFANSAHCVNPRTLLVPSSCQDEMERMNEEMSSILSKDFEYLLKIVDFKSFEAYFYDWAKDLIDDADEGDVPYPLLSPSRSMLFCFVIAATSVFLLQVYGFGVFSKY